MFRVLPPPIIRSTHNCIYSIWYLSNRYCYLPLSWKIWNYSSSNSINQSICRLIKLCAHQFNYLHINQVSCTLTRAIKSIRAIKLIRVIDLFYFRVLSPLHYQCYQKGKCWMLGKRPKINYLFGISGSIGERRNFTFHISTSDKRQAFSS